METPINEPSSIFRLPPGNAPPANIFGVSHLLVTDLVLHQDPHLKKRLPHGFRRMAQLEPCLAAFDENNGPLWDVLEKGPHSKHRSDFVVSSGKDFHFQAIPIRRLKEPLHDAIRSGRLRLGFRLKDGLSIRYETISYPCNLASYASLFREFIPFTRHLQMLPHERGELDRLAFAFARVIRQRSPDFVGLKNAVSIWLSKSPHRLSVFLEFVSQLHTSFVLDLLKQQYFRFEPYHPGEPAIEMTPDAYFLAAGQLINRLGLDGIKIVGNRALPDSFGRNLSAWNASTANTSLTDSILRLFIDRPGYMQLSSPDLFRGSKPKTIAQINTYRLSHAAIDYHALCRRIQIESSSQIHELNLHPFSLDQLCRLHVLSEVADEFLNHCKEWSSFNPRLIPKRAEYLLHQILLITWPLTGTINAQYAETVVQMALDQIGHDAKNEQGVRLLVYKLLFGDCATNFRQLFEPFACKIAYFGMINSLSAITLHLSSPGIPEIADLPVETVGDLHELKLHWKNGQLKSWLTETILKTRNQFPSVFGKGQYRALKIEGPQKNHVVAFYREHESESAIIAVPRLVADLGVARVLFVPPTFWHQTHVVMPESHPPIMTNCLTGQKLHLKRRTVALESLLHDLPWAVLTAQKSPL